MEIENLKRAFRLICCCNRCNTLDEDEGEKTEVDTAVTPENSAKKGVGLSFVSVTPHSRLKALSFVLGVDSIDALVSDFEHSVGHIIIKAPFDYNLSPLYISLLYDQSACACSCIYNYVHITL